MHSPDDTRGPTGPDEAPGKAGLRQAVLGERDRLTADERRTRSEAACRQLIALPELARATTVFCFVSFRSEVSTEPFLRWCLENSRTLAAPRVTGPRRMSALRVDDLAVDLAPGAWGIREPLAERPVVDPAAIDLAVVPGVVFDAHGGRAGYGGGFYDSFLAHMRADAPRVALAFELQLVHEVPREAHDLGVDVIVSESRVVRCRARRRSGGARP